MSAESRALGALLGLAIGDALGMPTQYQPRALIAARYGILDWFQPGPDDNFISRGMAAGRVTDDTDQAVLLGEMLSRAADAASRIASPRRSSPGRRG
jgi:ADP-ribosylglycohydrolase